MYHSLNKLIQLNNYKLNRLNGKSLLEANITDKFSLSYKNFIIIQKTLKLSLGTIK